MLLNGDGGYGRLGMVHGMAGGRDQFMKEFNMFGAKDYDINTDDVDHEQAKLDPAHHVMKLKSQLFDAECAVANLKSAILTEQKICHPHDYAVYPSMNCVPPHWKRECKKCLHTQETSEYIERTIQEPVWR